MIEWISTKYVDFVFWPVIEYFPYCPGTALIETALTGDTLYLKTLWGQHIKLNHADTNLEFHAYTKP